MEPSHDDHPSEEAEMSQARQSGGDVGGQEVGTADICQFFLQGRCHFGSRCRLLHSASPPTADALEVVEKTQGSGQTKEGKTKKTRIKKKVDKHVTQFKELEIEEPSKKPRMRTAGDVVSRILWDPSLDPSDFAVGYLDRFLGVLERPFSEFSWDCDVCSCDFAEELALPQHRIKYFTYKGQRIWDRESRMDGVFGSTGGTLELPFCAREDVGEAYLTEESGPNDLEDTHELYNKEEDLLKFVEPYTKNDRKTSNVDSCNIDTGQQVQEHNLNKICTGDIECNRTIKTTVMNKENTETETQKRKNVCGSELLVLTAQLTVAQSGSKNTEKAEGEEEEWKDSWDGEEEQEHLSWYMCSPPGGSVATDEVLTKMGNLEQRSKSSRYKPTHFITFRTDSPAFIASFHRLQKELSAVLPHSVPYWVSPETLHVTLCLLILPGPKEVNIACEALRDFARKHRPPSFSLSCSSKLDHFYGRVLYLTPEPLSQIQSLNHHFQNLYKKNGWLHRDSLSPKFHLTLAKVKGKSSERPFAEVKDICRAKRMSTIDFGKLVVNKLYLCVNGSLRREDGFYETLCTINLE